MAAVARARVLPVRLAQATTGEAYYDLVAAFWEQVRGDLRHGWLEYPDRCVASARAPGLHAYRFLHTADYIAWVFRLPDEVDPFALRAVLLREWPAGQEVPPAPERGEDATVWRARAVCWHRERFAATA